MTISDVDRPQESSQADVTLVARGITLPAAVRMSGADAVVVVPDNPVYARNVAPAPGDQAELFWRTDAEERTLPAQVAEVEADGDPVWHLRPTGPAERSMRRKAVRARVELPVRISVADVPLMGETIDASEAGLRARVEGWGLPPEPGTVATVALDFDGGHELVAAGEIVRVENRGGWWTLSVSFVGLPEKDEDRLRRRVFRALREERARTSV